MRGLSTTELLDAWAQGYAQPPPRRALVLLTSACPELEPDALARLTIGQRDSLLLPGEAIAAARLGLATCRMGLSEMAFAGDAAMREKHGIPSNERVDGILALGYSALQWKQLPPRGPVKAVWK